MASETFAPAATKHDGAGAVANDDDRLSWSRGPRLPVLTADQSPGAAASREAAMAERLRPMDPPPDDSPALKRRLQKSN